MSPRVVLIEAFGTTGKQDEADATIETLKAIEHPISKQALILVDVCSYAGTGNVLKIQSMLYHCNDHLNVTSDAPASSDETPAAAADGDTAMATDEPTATAPGGTTDAPAAADASASASGATADAPKTESDTHQAFAVLGIALIAMGEQVGSQMSIRQFNHLVSGFR